MTAIYKILPLLLFTCIFGLSARCQLSISGTVYDSTKQIPVRDVTVKSSNGTSTITDTLGHFVIVTSDRDSLTFVYKNKPTAKFAVKSIPNIANFEISLHIRVPEKFRTLKEVTVFSRSYRQDSAENRDEYAKFFNYKKPGIRTTTDSYTESAGMDLDELINIFKFKRNKQLKRMQDRVLEEEKENYINYRFNKTTVRRITGITGNDLDIFMKEYRPDFEFTQNSSLVDFYQYILNASYDYKRRVLLNSKSIDSLQKHLN